MASSNVSGSVCGNVDWGLLVYAAQPHSMLVMTQDQAKQQLAGYEAFFSCYSVLMRQNISSVSLISSQVSFGCLAALLCRDTRQHLFVRFHHGILHCSASYSLHIDLSRNKYNMELDQRQPSCFSF